MRSLLFFTLAVNVMWAADVLCADQWSGIGPHYWGVQDLVADTNGDLYVLGVSQVVKFQGGGSSSQTLSDGLPLTGLWALTKDAAGNLSVGVNGARIYTLPTGGTTWQQVVATGPVHEGVLAADSGGALYSGGGLGQVSRLPAGGTVCHKGQIEAKYEYRNEGSSAHRKSVSWLGSSLCSGL